MGEPAVTNVEMSGFLQVSLSAIDVNPNQPRRYFDQNALEELAQSIRVHGVLQPIILNPSKTQGRYRIVAGERRFRASMMAEQTTIPCIIQDFAPREAMEAALIENIQRRDLNPIETARALNTLMRDHKQTQEQLAERLGMNRVTLANTLRLLQLSEEMQNLVAGAGISAGHARALLSVPEQHRHELLKHIIEQGLSVRQTEQAAKRMQSAKKEPENIENNKDFDDLCDSIRNATGMSVRIIGTLSNGTITLNYNNRVSLETLYKIFAQ
ncbi:MAG: ParB/RepB/Spo0J family partition protein [Clostridia bacterium]|nr:ParB/RepB/Spo0J family partition protein [Clostridia bacterium]